jgi:hypothetical protein
MAAVTTNYGFDVPTSSDLVKNGATQIALLGQDIDTFLFRPFTKNGVLNSSFDIWQRGTSVALAASTSIANSYTADRFQMPTNANQACTVSRQATNDTTNLPNIQYCGRFQRNSGQTGTGTLNPSYNLESADSIPYAGKQITFSFYARAGANYSNAGSTLRNFVVTGTGSDQNLQNGYTGQTTLINNNVTLTTTWQRFIATATVATNATQIGFYFQWIPVGTAGANDYFEVTGIQLEVGNQASPYTRATGTIQGELAACQRYYYRATSAENAYTRFGGANGAGSTTAVLLPFVHPVTMRTKPSAIEYGGTYALSDGNGTASVSSVALFQGSSANQTIMDVTCSGATQFRPYIFIANNSTSTYIGVTAEL